MDAIVRSIQQFNYIRAFTIGFFIFVAFFVFQQLAEMLGNFIAPIEIISGQVLVTIMHILYTSFYVFLLIIAPILYFRKSEYDIMQTFILCFVLIVCVFALIWVRSTILTLLDDEGIMHGGSLGNAAWGMIFFFPVTTVLILKLSSKQ